MSFFNIIYQSCVLNQSGYIRCVQRFRYHQIQKYMFLRRNHLIPAYIWQNFTRKILFKFQRESDLLIRRLSKNKKLDVNVDHSLFIFMLSCLKNIPFISIIYSISRIHPLKMKILRADLNRVCSYVVFRNPFAVKPALNT